MTDRARDTREQRLADAIPVLLLLAPFVVFVRHQAYSLWRTEVLVCLLGFSAVGVGLAMVARRGRLAAAAIAGALVVAFVDLQFDVAVPVEGIGETAALLVLWLLVTPLFYLGGRPALALTGIMTAVGLLTTLALPPGRLVMLESRTVRTGNGQPFVLHLILDEHIGIAGLRAAGEGEAGRQLASALAGNGFRVFEAAYSEYAETVQAIGHALDLAPGQYIEGLVGPAPAPFAGRLTRSRYFEQLAARGYAIDVYQADHLDVCHSSVPVASCLTYASAKLGVLESTTLPWAARARVILGAYLMRSDVWNEGRELYNGLRERVPALGRAVPRWNWERTRVSPIATALVLEQLEDRLRRADRGRAVVAHLLLPHFPYTYTSSCELRPPSAWRDRNDPLLADANNTPGGRARRYALYVDQLACTHRWIARLLDAIPADVRRDAVVVLQGDHGSRISLIGGKRPALALLDADVIDAQSALFAVRAPRLAPGADVRQASASCLLAALARGEFRTSLDPGVCREPATFMVRVEDRYVTRPLPEFPGALPRQPAGATFRPAGMMGGGVGSGAP